MKRVFPCPAAKLMAGSTRISATFSTLNTRWLSRRPRGALKLASTLASSGQVPSGFSWAETLAVIYFPLNCNSETEQCSSAEKRMFRVMSGRSLISPCGVISSMRAPMVCGGSSTTSVSPKSFQKIIRKVLNGVSSSPSSNSSSSSSSPSSPSSSSFLGFSAFFLSRFNPSHPMSTPPGISNNSQGMSVCPNSPGSGGVTMSPPSITLASGPS